MTPELTEAELDAIERSHAWYSELEKRLFALARKGLAAEWRDIATAPKDGTAVILLIPYNPEKFELYRCVDAGFWEPLPRDADTLGVPQWGIEAGGCWRFEGDDGGFDIQPTHWMPLPPPPAASSSEPTLEERKPEPSGMSESSRCNGLGPQAAPLPSEGELLARKRLSEESAEADKAMLRMKRIFAPTTNREGEDNAKHDTRDSDVLADAASANSDVWPLTHSLDDAELVRRLHEYAGVRSDNEAFAMSHAADAIERLVDVAGQRALTIDSLSETIAALRAERDVERALRKHDSELSCANIDRWQEANDALRADNARLRDLIWRNVDPCAVSPEDQVICDEIARATLAHEGKE